MIDGDDVGVIALKNRCETARVSALFKLMSDYRSRTSTSLPGPAECAGRAADPETLLHGEETDLPTTLRTHTDKMQT